MGSGHRTGGGRRVPVRGDDATTELGRRLAEDRRMMASAVRNALNLQVLAVQAAERAEEIQQDNAALRARIARKVPDSADG